MPGETSKLQHTKDEVANLSPTRTIRAVLACVICIAAVTILQKITQQGPNSSHVWNLFLAIIPLALSSTILTIRAKIPTVATAMLSVIWLLFLPNAFYVITDLVDITRLDFSGATTLVAYTELLVIAATAIFGVMAGVISLADMRAELIRHNIVFIAIFPLSGFGLYLGKFLRLNSWDVLDPWMVVTKIFQGFDLFAVQISTLFTLFVIVAYIVYVKILRE